MEILMTEKNPYLDPKVTKVFYEVMPEISFQIISRKKINEKNEKKSFFLFIMHTAPSPRPHSSDHVITGVKFIVN